MMKKIWFIGTLLALTVWSAAGQVNKDVMRMSSDALHEEEKNWDGQDPVR